MRVLATNDLGVYAVEVGAGLRCAVHLERQQWSPLAPDDAAAWRPLTRDDSDRLFSRIRTVLDRGRQTIGLADDGKGPYGKAPKGGGGAARKPAPRPRVRSVSAAEGRALAKTMTAASPRRLDRSVRLPIRWRMPKSAIVPES